MQPLIELTPDQTVVFFTGAGMSAESGMPIYRGQGGIWSQYRYEEYACQRAFDRDPAKVQDFHELRRERMLACVPHAGYLRMAEMQKALPRTRVITQNIDGLHQRSGVPASKIIELHGNSTYATCLDCGHRHELAPIKQAFLADGTLPVCEKCDGIVKTATISFGQAMPEIQMARAQDETMQCDLFIVLGSSLVVYPAAGFPRIAKRRGASLVILNRDPTDQDDDADLVVHGEIGPTMSRVVGVN